MVVELRREAPRERDVRVERLGHPVWASLRLDLGLHRVHRRELIIGAVTEADASDTQVGRKRAHPAIVARREARVIQVFSGLPPGCACVGPLGPIGLRYRQVKTLR